VIRPAALAALLLAPAVVAAPVPKAVKKQDDVDRIVGRWKCESAFNGKEEMVGSHKNDVWTFAPAGEKSEQLTPTGTRYSLDYSFPAPGERQMNLACNGNPYLGVYELDGDTLTIAFRDRNRPATLDKAAGVYLFTFRREGAK
jgi:uncharacterized protein (TIGR03067 family)